MEEDRVKEILNIFDNRCSNLTPKLAFLLGFRFGQDPDGFDEQLDFFIAL